MLSVLRFVGSDYTFGIFDLFLSLYYNILHEIPSLVGKTPCSFCQNRKEKVVLTRCRIGHIRLAHRCLFNTEERPECIPCNFNYSLKHILSTVVDVRQTFYNINHLYDVF